MSAAFGPAFVLALTAVVLFCVREASAGTAPVRFTSSDARLV